MSWTRKYNTLHGKACAVVNEGGTAVAHVSHPLETTTATFEQNAAMIEAAPDLLQALKDMMNAHSADIEVYEEGDYAWGAWERAEAAIAKAEVNQ